MGKRLKIISLLVNCWAYISPFLAAVYLLFWLVQFFDMETFWEMDMYIGFLPRIFNMLFPVYVEYHGTQIIMSYVHCAGFLIITTFIAFKCEKIIFKLQTQNQENDIKEKFEQIEKESQKVPEEPKYPIERINHFYALFELKLEYYNQFDKSLEELERLKNEYSKILMEKLKIKYPKIRFSLQDGLFAYCDDFSLINDFCADVVKLYKIFYEIDYDKLIKTDLLFCFWSDYKKTDMKTAFKIVSHINKLNYLNKIVVSDKFALRYENEQNKIYELISLGPVRLDVEYEFNNALEMDLFYLKK